MVSGPHTPGTATRDPSARFPARPLTFSPDSLHRARPRPSDAVAVTYNERAAARTHAHWEPPPAELCRRSAVHSERTPPILHRRRYTAIRVFGSYDAWARRRTRPCPVCFFFTLHSRPFNGTRRLGPAHVGRPLGARRLSPRDRVRVAPSDLRGREGQGRGIYDATERRGRRWRVCVYSVRGEMARRCVLLLSHVDSRAVDNGNNSRT